MTPTADASPVGKATMSPAMEQMSCYAQYLFSKVEGVLGSRVMELGFGYGQYTRALLASGRSVLATDIDRDSVERAQQQYAGNSNVEVGWIDLNDAASVRAHHDYQADSIICFNVIEHLPNDVDALGWLRETVQTNAGMGLIVPAHPGLFGKMDEEAGHFRRYTRRSLRRALEESGWKIERLRYLNLVGGLGWWYHNRVRRNAGLADNSVNSQMVRVDRWLPGFARITDPFCSHFMGLSVMAWARA